MSGITEHGINSVDTGVSGKAVATNLVTPTNRGATYNVQYSEKFVRNIKVRDNNANQLVKVTPFSTAETSYNFAELFDGSVAGTNARLLFNKMDSFYATILNTYSHTTSENWVFDFIYFNLPDSFGEVDDSTDFSGSNVYVYLDAGSYTCRVDVTINGVGFNTSFKLDEIFAGYERVTFIPDTNGYVITDANVTAEKSLYNVHESTLMSQHPSGVIIVPRTIPSGTPSCEMVCWAGNNDGVVFDKQIVAVGGFYNSHDFNAGG